MAKAITSPPPSPPTSMATSCSTPCKRRKIMQSSCCSRHPLLPGLPDHIAELCLFKVHPSFLYSVCRAWRKLVYSPSFPPFLSLYVMLTPTGSSSTQQQFEQEGISDKIELSTFDPVASKWRPLPSSLADQPLTFLIRHPSFLSRNFPIQSVSVSGTLILLAGTAHNFFPAISRPLIFNPISGRWSAGPTLLAPRRWCAAGVSAGSVYVASGVGAQFSPDVARSVEKWNLNSSSSLAEGRDNFSSARWNWQKLSDLKDGRFSRDAIDAVGWRGKLCMVNIKGGVPREGVVYDVESDKWHEMAKGMIRGWTGPAAAMDEDVMYAVDIASGALRKYDPEKDTWHDVMLSAYLRGAQQIAAAGKRVCAVCDGGASIAVVDVESAQPRLWLLDNPDGFQALAVHILPRMSGPNLAEEF